MLYPLSAVPYWEMAKAPILEAAARAGISVTIVVLGEHVDNWGDLLPDDGRQFQHLSFQILYVST